MRATVGVWLSIGLFAAPAAAATAAMKTPLEAAAARVERFNPEGTVKQVRQVTARFTTPIVTLGDPRLGDPFDVACDPAAAGHGRWIGVREWSWDFEHDLPAGVRCKLTTKPQLADRNGESIAPQSFEFDTGGPAIVASLPREGAQDVDEKALFIVALDGAATPSSIAAHARCEVNGIGEQIPADVAAGDARTAALASARNLRYEYAALIFRGEPDYYRPHTADEVAAAEADLVVLSCRRALPPSTEVRVVWGAGIESSSGIATTADQTFVFRTRPEFTARFECDRVNADAGCLPGADMNVSFSAPIAREQARAIRLVAGEATYTPKVENAATVTRATFAGPFPESTAMRFELPAGLTDDAARPLANAARFPLDVRTDAAPPLAKFAGQFGILEASEGGVLPVTLRALESEVAAQRVPGAKRRIDDDAEIVRWIERVRTAMAPAGHWESPQRRAPAREDSEGDEGRWVEETGSTSVFGEVPEGTESFVVPHAANAGMEVVGIPLGTPGFYVVELASPRLGAALLGAQQPRYVATSALVTNLAVHLQWGREGSLVWVTSLDEGEPVADADVRISDSCTGSLLWRGVTNTDGIASIGEHVLPEPHEYAGCDSWHAAPLFVSARVAGDLGFTLSSWNEGIAPSRFGLPQGSWAGPVVAHTVLDRTLLRAGETVSMKHFLRTQTARGFETPAGIDAPKLTIRHDGSGQSYELPVAFDAAGIAESTWAIPADAKLGSYQLQLTMKRDGKDVSFWPGSFRVEQYRVPTMRAVVQGPKEPLVNATSVPLDLAVSYLSGGGAADAPVKLRTVVESRTVGHPDYDEFSFGGEAIVEGVTADTSAFAAEEPGNKTDVPRVTPLVLDDTGALRTMVTDLPTISEPHALVAELEFQDPNGEITTVATRVPLWSAAVQVGIATEGWAASEDELRFRVLVLDLDGKPLEGENIQVELFSRDVYSYRRRLVGGFYAYENQTEMKRLEPTCDGTTDERGLVLCEVAPGTSGAIVLRARAEDDAGNAAVATREMWVTGDEDWWFGGGEDDRMDVLPEQKRYEPGDTARLQVRMPFRAATALVTVEREGVLQSFVTELDGSESVIDVPIDGAYAPNVYVSVLAVRGRVGSLATWFADLAREWDLPWRFDGGSPTGLVDLSKPAYRLGIARIDVGWRDHTLDVAVKPDKDTFEVRDRAHVAVTVNRAGGGPLPKDAEIAFAAVDEGLLELSPNGSWKLLDEMMQRRGIEVFTSTAQMQVVGKRHYGKKAVQHGGGGGHEPARELFDTLLLWRGRVPLDANGRADVTVPLVDSLTSYRLVAIANAGDGFFGTGEATIRTAQDTILTAGVPPVVRAGDRYRATFTVRNASRSAQTLTIGGSVDYSNAPADLTPLDIELGPGKARELTWEQTVPNGVERAQWQVSAATKDGRTADKLRVEQRVIPVHPVRVQQATLQQLDAPFRIDLASPAGALPGRGGIELAVQARLADSLDGVREYMARYPYGCFEQRTSKAIALHDGAGWDALMAMLPAYLDGDGLIKYFPVDWLHGSDALTSYVLTIAHEAGRAIPDAERESMLKALTAFVEGRVQRSSSLPTADLAIRKLTAIAALARYGAAQARLLGSIDIEPNLWPTSALLDWIDVLRRVTDVPNRATRLAEAERMVRARMNLQGTTFDFSTEASDGLPWLMVGPDYNAVRALAFFAAEGDWRADVPRMARGALGRRSSGHWLTTTANAWGVVAFDKFSATFEKTSVAGVTSAELGGNRRTIDWTKPERTANWPWPTATATLAVEHAGAGRPWATVTTRAALPLTAPLTTGYSIVRDVSAVSRTRPNVWSVGDVVRVHLTIDAQSDATWVVVDDPVPTGATLLGSGLGRDSALLTANGSSDDDTYPAFVERRFDGYRAYYEYVPKGKLELTYTLRLNTPGRFELPATRVEAMYAPEKFGELPNDAVPVAPP